jgi:hypothetical protein
MSADDLKLIKSLWSLKGYRSPFFLYKIWIGEFFEFVFKVLQLKVRWFETCSCVDSDNVCGVRVKLSARDDIGDIAH